VIKAKAAAATAVQSAKRTDVELTLGLSLQGRPGARGRAVAKSSTMPSVIPDLHLARSGRPGVAQIAVIAGGMALAQQDRVLI
jgi:hypothetical protein